LQALQNSRLYVGFGKNLNLSSLRSSSLEIFTAFFEHRMELAGFSGSLMEKHREPGLYFLTSNIPVMLIPGSLAGRR